jgi:glycosyltransferase involved in cell wall biosynthesis
MSHHNEILISCAMACYNQESYVAEAIESITKQSYPFWELVIVNDCSTDKSLEIINNTIKKFNIANKVRIINNESNKGYGITLNKAIIESKGELVAIIDSDDALFDKDALKISVKKHLSHPEVSMTYSNYNECDRNMRVIDILQTRQLANDEAFLRPKLRIRVSHLKVLKKKYFNMTEGINPKLRQTVDKDLVLKLEEVGKLLFIDKVLYNYRKHNKNLTRSTRRKDKDYQKFVMDMRKEIYDSARSRRKNKK